MKKKLLCILVWLYAIIFSFAQTVSPGLDALFLNSEIIVQGTFMGKYCRPPMDVNSAVMEICVASLDITEIIKGNPKLSIKEIKQHIVSSPSQTVTTFDTITTLCFAHTRNKFADPYKSVPYPDTTFYYDYDIKVGDEVLVFLKGESESTPVSRLRIPKDWTVYSLVDRYLGVITANDYVSRYLFDKIKKTTGKQK